MILHTIIQTVLCIIIKLLSIASPAARKLLLSILAKILELITKLKFIKNLCNLPLKYIKKFLKKHTVQHKSSKRNSEDTLLYLLNPKYSNLRHKVKHQIPICTDSIAYYFHTANTPESSDSEESEETEEKKRTEKSEETSEQKETMEVTETSTNPSETSTALCNIEQGENQPEVEEKMDETVIAFKRKANESECLTKRLKSPDTSQPGTSGIWCRLPRFQTSQLDSKNIAKDVEIERTKSSKTENLSAMDVEGAAESNLNNNKTDVSAPCVGRKIQYTDNLHSGIRDQSSFEDPVNASTEIKDMETGERSTSEASQMEQSGSSAAKPGTSGVKTSEVASKAKPKKPEVEFLSPSKLDDWELEIIGTLPCRRSSRESDTSEKDSDEGSVQYVLDKFNEGKIPEKVETSAAEISEVEFNPRESQDRNAACESHERKPELKGLINMIEQNADVIRNIDIISFLEKSVIELWRKKLAPESCGVTENTDREDSKRVCGDNRDSAIGHDIEYSPHPGMAPYPGNVKKDAKHQKKFFRQQRESKLKKGESTKDRSQSSQISSDSPSDEGSTKSAQIASESLSDEGSSKSVQSGFKPPSGISPGPEKAKKDTKHQKKSYRERKESTSLTKGDIEDHSQSSQIVSESPSGEDSSRPVQSGIGSPSGEARSKNVGNEPVIHTKKLGNIIGECVENMLGYKRPSAEKTEIDLFSDEYRARYIPRTELSEIVIEGASSRESDMPETSMSSLSESSRSFAPSEDSLLPSTGLQTSDSAEATGSDPLRNSDKNKQTKTSEISLVTHDLDPVEPICDPPSDIESKVHSIPLVPISGNQSREISEHKTKEISIEEYLSFPRSKDGSNSLNLNLSDDAINNITKPIACDSEPDSDLELVGGSLQPSSHEHTRQTTARSSVLTEQETSASEVPSNVAQIALDETSDSRIPRRDESSNSQGEQTSSFHKKGPFEQHFDDGETSKMSPSTEKKITKEPQIYVQDHGDRIRSEMECEESPTMECEAAKSPEMECEESHEMECEAAMSPEMECEESHEMECEAAKSPEMECEESHGMECEETSELTKNVSESLNLSEGCSTQRKLELKNEKPELGEQNKMDKTASINLGKDSESLNSKTVSCESLPSLTLGTKENIDKKEISEQPDSTDTDVHESPLDQPMSEDADENPNVAESNQSCESEKCDSNE